MQIKPDTVILLISDIQVRKGMSLLFEDMGFTVLSASSYFQFDKQSIALAKPVLIVLSMTDDSPLAVENSIETIRNDLHIQIPVICLNSEATIGLNPDLDSDILILPEQIKPKAIRQKVYDMLNNKG
ncbi:MAG: hypothetical protein OEY11_01290 [Gammaproteobacteria bacterium]|nr:hypothetical protein [Gammaproteobacteria bacterium]